MIPRRQKTLKKLSSKPRASGDDPSMPDFKAHLNE